MLLNLLDGHFNAMFYSLIAFAAYMVISSRRRFPPSDQSKAWDFASGLAEFLHDNASRVMVLSAFVVLVVLGYRLTDDPASRAKFIDFCQSKATDAFTAFLTLTVANRLTNGSNGNGNTPHT
jgi:hypothetical protein